VGSNPTPSAKRLQPVSTEDVSGAVTCIRDVVKSGWRNRCTGQTAGGEPLVCWSAARNRVRRRAGRSDHEGRPVARVWHGPRGHGVCDPAHAPGLRAVARHEHLARGADQAQVKPLPLSELFPPPPASPGSGCPQLHQGATAQRGRSLTSQRCYGASWRTGLVDQTLFRWEGEVGEQSVASSSTSMSDHAAVKGER
jgi:hypothetical protein